MIKITFSVVYIYFSHDNWYIYIIFFVSKLQSEIKNLKISNEVF